MYYANLSVYAVIESPVGRAWLSQRLPECLWCCMCGAIGLLQSVINHMSFLLSSECSLALACSARLFGVQLLGPLTDLISLYRFDSSAVFYFTGSRATKVSLLAIPVCSALIYLAVQSFSQIAIRRYICRVKRKKRDSSAMQWLDRMSMQSDLELKVSERVFVGGSARSTAHNVFFGVSCSLAC